MDVREQLHDALDAEDFPSRALLSRSIAGLDRPPPRRGYSRLATATAAVLAVALIATLVAIRVNSVSSLQPLLPTSPLIDNLVDYQFLSPQVGFVELRSYPAAYGPGITASPYIISPVAVVFASTSDGGRTWHRILSLSAQSSTPTMQWLDARNGFVIGQRSHSTVLWRTTDGGLHWQSHAVPVPHDVTPFGSATVALNATLESAYFLSPVQGWVVYRWQGDCGGCGFSAERYVFETNDGGLHWTELGASALGPAQRQLTFFTSSWGVLSSPFAFYELAVTHDEGRTWHESVTPPLPTKCMVSVPCEYNAKQTHRFFADGVGLMAISWCAGEGGLATEAACYQAFPFQPTEAHLYRTTDGGLTWAYFRDIPLSTGSISFIDPHRFVSVGPDGVSWTSDAGATWSAPYVTPVPLGWYVRSSEFNDAKHGWLALASSPPAASLPIQDPAYLYQLRATSDGGATWHQIGLPRA